MRFRKIYTRILAAILPVVFVAMIAFVSISYFASIHRIHNEMEQKMFAILDTETVRIQDELNRDLTIAQSLVSYAETASREDFLTGAYARYMARLIPVSRSTTGGGIWFEPYRLDPDIRYFGPYYYHEHGSDAYTLTFMYSNEAYDYPNTEWYQRAKNTGDAIAWTDVYYDALSGISMLTGAIPFYGEAGEFLGVCTADKNIIDIQQFIREIEIGESGRAFLIGSKGNFLSFREADKTADMLITEDSDAELAALGREIMDNEKGITSVDRGGVKRRVYFQTVPGINWKLGIAIDEAEIAAPAVSLLWTMLVVSIITVAVIALSVLLLARYLRGIISRVNDFSHLAASGHLEERLHLDVQDEFSSIADNLNIMMENMGRMSRAKSDFLSRMSHEIRTPMNAIVGMAQIAKNTQDAEKIDNCLQKIEESSKHLLGIINDILDYSKVEAGKLTLDKALFSLTENMDFVISMLKERAAEKNIDLALSLRGIVHDGVQTDALRLNQVLINLLSNAVKFTAEGGHIAVDVEEISYEDGQGIYRFAVRDDGIGIAPEQAQRIFSPFVQADAHISSRYGGTGLGLVISKSIVEMLGGTLSLQSALGAGSTFSFTIPLVAQREAGKAQAMAMGAAAQPENPDLSHRRILIVDDIQINREIILELLSATGIRMETAENGKEALDMFAGSPAGYYDAILMDMQMPVMDGCAATREIRDLGRPDARAVRIIAMTANVLKEDVERALEAGMDGHIAKPINIAEVVRTLTDLP